jgi:hypothetical protein
VRRVKNLYLYYMSTTFKKLIQATDPDNIATKINKINSLLSKKIIDLQKKDDLCKYNKEFEIKEEGQDSICKNERLNDRIPRDHMPQIINGKLFLSNQVFIDSMVNFIKSYKGNLDRSSVEEEILKGRKFLNKINENNYVEIYIALINLYRNKREDELRKYITKLKDRSIEDIVNEESKFGSSLQKFNINEIRPSQDDILSSKTAGIAAFILVKSLDGIEIKNQEIDENDLVKLIEKERFTERVNDLIKFFVSSKKPISNLEKISDLKTNLKKNVNKLCSGISVDSKGQIIDGHHRWSSCMLVKYIVNKTIPNLFEDEVFLNMKTMKTEEGIKRVLFETYYKKVFEHPLVFSLNKEDKFVEKPTEEVRNKYFRSPSPSLEGGKRKTKKRRKRSKRTKKRVRKTTKSRRRVKRKS